MNQLTDHTINTVRRIATKLRPDMLDKLGLKEAILSHTEEFEKRTGIKCLVKLPGDFEFGGNRDTTIFRIIQESLTNVARHSGASLVKIEAEIKNNEISFYIEDNGKGVTDEEMKNTKSLGIVGIRERAYSEDGALSILSEKGKGMKLIVSMPVKK
jgi:signal transduction histidine kinase